MSYNWLSLSLARGFRPIPQAKESEQTKLALRRSEEKAIRAVKTISKSQMKNIERFKQEGDHKAQCFFAMFFARDGFY